MAPIDFTTQRAQRHTDAILDGLEALQDDMHLAVETCPPGAIRDQLERLATLAAQLEDIAIRHIGGVIVTGADLDLRLRQLHQATRPPRPVPMQLELMGA